MKKLLMLVLVCAMASLANAGLLLTVNGLSVDSITVAPNTDLAIGIETDATIPAGISFSVVASVAGGTITTLGDGMTEYVGPIDSGNIMGFVYPGGVTNGMIYPGDEDGAFGGIGIFGGNGVVVTTGTVALFNNINLNAGQTLTLKLYMMDNDNPTLVTSTADSAEVVVIPEPATVALLTLGGLLLRRKK